MTGRHIRSSLDTLASDHRPIRRALELVGYPDERRRPEGFETLLRVIIGQQISVQAATAIYQRLDRAMTGDISPESLLRRRKTTLRKAGLSAPKIRYVRCLAKASQTGELDFPGLSRLPDEEAINQIQAVPGLGLWSAQIYAMFSLGRPDIWPHADVGAMRGLQIIWRLADRPSPAQSAERVSPMSPHRSALALLAWRCANANAL